MKRILTSTILIVCCIAFLKAQNLSDSLLGYYPFNGNVNDSSMNAFNGIASDITFVTDPNGNPGRAASFNGNSSKIVTTLQQKGLTEYTISLWVKVNANSGNIILCHKGISGQGSGFSITDKAFGLDGDYALRLIGNRDNTPLANWYYLTGVWKGTAGTTIEPSQMQLYVNGIWVEDYEFLSAADSRSVPFDEDTALVIGRHSAWDQWFNGEIDELRIYKRALSAKEINFLYKGIFVEFAEKEIVSDSTYSIKWLSEEVSSVDLKYSADNGKTWNLITSGLTDSVYNWIVPQMITDSLKIRIVNHDSTDQYNETALKKVFISATYLDLAAWYPFDSNANDASGNNHHALVYGTSVTDISNSGKAFYFDGMDDYIKVTGLNPTQQFSITTWYKTNDSTGGIASLWGAGYISLNNYENTSHGKLCLTIENPTATYTIINDTVVTSDGDWHFAVVTVSNDEIKVYVDNRLVKTENVNGDMDYNYNEWNLGFYDYDPSSFRYEGILEDMRVYKTAIDEQVIHELYSAKYCELHAPVVNAGSDREVCAGDEITLTASGTADTYTWNNDVTNGVPFVITSSSTFVVTGTLNGCDTKDTLSIAVNNCTSALDNNYKENISIYPNPSAGNIFIKLNNNEKADIKIYNTSGELVRDIPELKEDIIINDLPKGVYLVRVTTSETTVIQKQILN